MKLFSRRNKWYADEFTKVQKYAMVLKVQYSNVFDNWADTSLHLILLMSSVVVTSNEAIFFNKNERCNGAKKDKLNWHSCFVDFFGKDRKVT